MERVPVAPSGLVIAVIGFVLTRFTVTLAARDSTAQFLFAGIVPLLLGLSLSAFGVILAVSSYDRRHIRTTALWCVLGTITMLALVVLTLLGTEPAALTDVDAAREQTSLSNFLIGGAVGGTLTGLYAAQNRRQRRDLRQQANRLILLNRLLRDQVINSATAIRGHRDVLEEQYNEQSVEIVGEQADAIIDTVENVKYLSETADTSDQTLGAIDLSTAIRTELGLLEERFPEAECTFSGPEDIEVRANGQLREALRHLFENAVEYSDADTPQLAVELTATRTTATLEIADNGPGLPPNQQALLERGEIAEFDDPTTGFGLNIVRLLVESFEGTIRTSVSEDGTTVEMALPRAAATTTTAPSTTAATPGVSPSRVVLTVGVSLIAGVTMGAAMLLSGGDIPVIGALYGIENTVVALVTHEFHSVVFGLVYAGVLSAIPLAHARDFAKRVAIAVGLGLSLWFVAAGLVMPIWLELVGIGAPLPNLTLPSLVGHAVWGATMGVLYHAGDRWLATSAVLENLSVPTVDVG